MTGWQLTANRIYLCAMVSAQLATTRWHGSRLTWCDGMQLHSCCGTISKRGLLEIQYQTSCLQYLHMANISDGNTDNNHSSPFRGQRLFILL